jgi:hypothetical protein
VLESRAPTRPPLEDLCLSGVVCHPHRPPLAPFSRALAHGTFYSLDELPGRDVASIGHPLTRGFRVLAEGEEIGL